MEGASNYKPEDEYHTARHLAEALATMQNSNPNAIGYHPLHKQPNASIASINDALRIVTSLHVRDRVSQLIKLNDERFFEDVRRYLRYYL